jgi:hypothetical protein
VHANAHFDAAFRRRHVVAIVQNALDLDGTVGAGECAGKLDEETVADGVDLPAAVPGKRFAQELTLLVEQIGASVSFSWVSAL